MELWTAWQTDPPDPIGIFDDRAKAEAACVEYGDAIAGPLDLNDVAPREPIDLPYAYWPDFEAE